MKKYHHSPRRALALLLALVMCLGLATTAFAAQEDNYHDPAEKWLTASNRTNELDVNSVVSNETFNCAHCDMSTSFWVYRAPEYTRDGQTALTRNVKYSDGTMLDGVTVGVILDGTPGVNAFYTGYHWTKAVCQTCGTINSNGGGYAYGKNLYWLYDCAAEFTETLDEVVTYEYTDSTYHTRHTTNGSYCCFCFGTHKTETTALERHTLEHAITPQLANQRFVVKDACSLCEYEESSYVAAKSVITSYYGEVDGQPHTLTVTDLSEAGVRTSIRYGNSADACTLTSAPNYTDKGHYTVYYEITYTYENTEMQENGVAYVWLDEEAANVTEINDRISSACACGCGDENCGCMDTDCGGGCCEDTGCNGEHNFVLLDSTAATCLTLGYDRYLCVDCGMVEKRDYSAALGHAWQGVVIREATCEADGKLMELCARCGEAKVTATDKGAHTYITYKVAATCTSSGYTVKECSTCGERQITNITDALAHVYTAHVTPATCEAGGHTVHLCHGCGSSFVTDYTAALGHSWDDGTSIANATCTGESVTEYRCVRCDYHRLEGGGASGHTPGAAATCTDPQLCDQCGAVIVKALGHDYGAEVTAPTCTELGYTAFACTRCGDSYKGEYVSATGHRPGDWIIDREPTTAAEGSKHTECEGCGKVLETVAIEKLYLTATTDTKGEAVVGGYLVTVTDTDTSDPVSNAAVALKEDGSISIRLPGGRLLDYADQTTVSVVLVKDASPVAGMEIAVTDRNANYAEGATDKAGQITVPGTTGQTNDEGKATVGYEDADGNRWTLTVLVEDFETGRHIEEAGVSIGRTGNITVTLPDGVDMDENNRITVIVTDQEKVPQPELTVIVKGDLGQTEQGQTDEEGTLTVPAVAGDAGTWARTLDDYHGAYVYGYPDGSFGPERNMTRSEAAAVFARLLAERKGEVITELAATKFEDIPENAWYSGYVDYLSEYGVIYGREDNTFAPDAYITRAEFTAMAVRFFEAHGGGDAAIMEQYDAFTDVSSGHWAAEYIRDAAIHGWVRGYGDGTFRADDQITRAEVVTLVNRLLGRSNDGSCISGSIRSITMFNDMTERHWAYYAVLEAANGHHPTQGED